MSHQAAEADVRADLEAVGFTVNNRPLKKDEYNAELVAGNFHLAFSETYGEPYDPHAFAGGWRQGDGEGLNHPFANLTGGDSGEELFQMIDDVLLTTSVTERERQWRAIHQYYHRNAVMLPMWGKRVPTVLNRRLTNYEPGHQQFDYPVHRLIVSPGTSRDLTIAPGGQTGLFQTVGRLDPHTYRPNEFFANNWVYEGLVTYGAGSQILPSLAESFDTEDNPDTGGYKYIFQLRQNVTFHDGAAWNCAAARLNFDHFTQGVGGMSALQDYTCESEFVFVVTTNNKAYTFLYDLAYIRPRRMLSPQAFLNGPTTDPITANSCEPSRTTIEGITCVGIANVAGTGPFVLASDLPDRNNRDPSSNHIDDEVLFTVNQDYWDGPAQFDSLKVVRYETTQAVKAALLNNELDIVWGSGVLTNTDILELRDQDDSNVNVFFSSDIQNGMIIFNTGKAPLNDFNVRKIIMHSIHKSEIVEKEQLGQVVDNVFPRHIRHCDVDLTPHWDYDPEKAVLLSCESEEQKNKKSSTSDDDDNKALAIGLSLGLGIPLLIVLGFFIYYFQKTKQYEAELVKKTENQAV